MKPEKLPNKCKNLKAAYHPATKWWCTFCAPTGGNICIKVCKTMGPLDKTKE